jgi:phosphate transport system substrate-binding protein
MSNSKSFSRRWLAACALAFATASLAQTPAPTPQVLRVWAYDGVAPQLLRWEQAYTAQHADVRFENHMHGAAAVMAGLYDGVADVVFMGREIWPVETMAYRWVYQQQPFGIIVATAGLHAPGQMFTPVVLVNAHNPLSGISVSQLDAIYGSEHRAAPANIRTWGDLGLQGEWKDKPIHPWGFGGDDALGVFFRHDVLRMDYKPNPASHLLSDRDGSPTPAAQRIAQAVAADPYAIGYASLPSTGGTKVVAVGEAEPIMPDDAALTSHEYAFTRSLWVYFRREPEKPLDPAVDGFVRFLLSPAAQSLVQPGDPLLSLTPELARKQIHKLDSPMPKIGAPVEEGN